MLKYAAKSTHLLRLITNIPLSIHLTLWVLIPLLRLPTFDLQFFLPEESFYLLAAQKLADGGHLYKDFWYSGPPLMVWLYRAVHGLFGESSLMAIRVMSCIYVYITTIYFTSLLSAFKNFRHSVGLIAIFFVVLTATPWYGMQMGASLFSLLPMCFAFFSILNLSEHRRQNYFKMYNAGIWIMVCTMTSYKFIFILLGLFITYLFLKTFRWDEVMALIGGMFTVGLAVLLILFYSGSLADYWDIGLRYYLDRMAMDSHDMYVSTFRFSLEAWLITWGLFILLGGLGFLQFRLRFYNYVAQIRSVELGIALWLMAVVFMIIFKFRRLDMDDFILMVPALSFYSVRVFHFRRGRRFRWIWMVLAFIMPLYTYSAYIGLGWPERFEFLVPSPAQKELHGGLDVFLGESHPLTDLRAKSEKDKESIWILDYQPALYPYLNRPCATKYMDFRMVWHKFEAFESARENLFFSNPEPAPEIFKSFRNNLPEMILDPEDHFRHLQQYFPGLFSDYSVSKKDSWTIYTLKESSKH